MSIFTKLIAFLTGRPGPVQDAIVDRRESPVQDTIDRSGMTVTVTVRGPAPVTTLREAIQRAATDWPADEGCPMSPEYLRAVGRQATPLLPETAEWAQRRGISQRTIGDLVVTTESYADAWQAALTVVLDDEDRDEFPWWELDDLVRHLRPARTLGEAITKTNAEFPDECRYSVPPKRYLVAIGRRAAPLLPETVAWAARRGFLDPHFLIGELVKTSSASYGDVCKAAPWVISQEDIATFPWWEIDGQSDSLKPDWMKTRHAKARSADRPSPRTGRPTN